MAISFAVNCERAVLFPVKCDLDPPFTTLFCIICDFLVPLINPTRSSSPGRRISLDTYCWLEPSFSSAEESQNRPMRPKQPMVEWRHSSPAAERKLRARKISLQRVWQITMLCIALIAMQNYRSVLDRPNLFDSEYNCSNSLICHKGKQRKDV